MDGLRQVGKFLDTSRKKTNHVAKNVSQNFPIIERVTDSLLIEIPFFIDFEVPGKDNQEFVDIIFISNVD